MRLDNWSFLLFLDKVRENGVAVDEIISEGFILRIRGIKEWTFM